MLSTINHSKTLKSIIIILALLFLPITIALSISLGVVEINLSTVWQAIFHFNSDITTHQVIQELRLPRAISAALVGASLAISGVIMQGMTQNPLASPSIMGVTDGAAFALVVMLTFFPGSHFLSLILATLFGACIAVILVLLISSLSSNGLTPVKLALAGIAIGTMLQSLTSVISLNFGLEQQLGFWLAGGLDATNWTSVNILFISGIVGLCLSFVISRAMTLLNLGNDVATSLGQNTLLIRVVGVLATVILTGTAVSVAGSIGFVGLIVPHVTRFIMGKDYRWLIPASAIFGALLLVLSDTAARLVNAPFETPVGAITSLIGVPFFLYLVRLDGGGIRG